MNFIEDPANLILDRIEKGEAEKIIMGYLKTELSELERTVYTLRFLQGLSVNDIAEQLSCTMQKVVKVSFGAKMKLGKKLLQNPKTREYALKMTETSYHFQFFRD